MMSQTVLIGSVLLAVLCQESWQNQVSAWTPAVIATATATRSCRMSSQSLALVSLLIRCRRPTASLVTALQAEADNTEKDRDDDDDDNGVVVPGMADAFRKLEALDSLGVEEEQDNDKDNSKVKGSSTPLEHSSKPASNVVENKSTFSSPDDLPAAEAAPPEKEVQMYKEMVKELEQQDEDDLYSNVLAAMGGTPTPKKESSSKPTPASVNPNVISSDNTQQTTEVTEEFMNQALQEAFAEVKVKNPSIGDSILDDREIMKEIEAIFERGNDKLMESLKEVRQEQLELAEASAQKNAQTAVDTLSGDAARLAQAQGAIEIMLKRVKKETSQVEKAVEDLKLAEAEMDKDFILRLKRGGIPKQAALVGVLLFSIRSIADTIASVSDESHLPAALIQGGVALACAAFLFLM